MPIDPSHAFGPWAPLANTPFEECRCTGCGGQQERATTGLAGYHGHSETLERPCGAPAPREGITGPLGAWLGGWGEQGRRYPYFEMTYPMVQEDGSIRAETFQFPVSEHGTAVGADPYPKPRRGVGGQIFE